MVGCGDVPGVIDVMLSEANSSAAIVLEALEGLLGVCASAVEPCEEVLGLERVAGSATNRSPRDRVRSRSAVGESDRQRLPTSRKVSALQAQARESNRSATNSGSTRHRRRHLGRDTDPRLGPEQDGPAAPAFGVTVSREAGVDGAALCVSLGAVPAVLLCLSRHAGHARVESLSVELLRVIAAGRSTSGAVRGNAAVTAVCAARLRRTMRAQPPAAVEAAAAPALASSVGVGPTKDTPGYHAAEERDGVSADIRAESAGEIDVEARASDGEGRLAVVRREGCTATATLGRPGPGHCAEVADVEAVMSILSVALDGSPDCQRLFLGEQGLGMTLAVLRAPAGKDERLVETCLRILGHLLQGEEGQSGSPRGDVVKAALSAVVDFRRGPP